MVGVRRWSFEPHKSPRHQSQSGVETGTEVPVLYRQPARKSNIFGKKRVAVEGLEPTTLGL